MKQCKYLDTENGLIHGGIITDDGDIICGCCGALIEADEIGTNEDCIAVILKVYDEWVDLDETICDDGTEWWYPEEAKE